MRFQGVLLVFCIGEKVVYKTNSVCCVEAIETPSFVSDKQKKYYKLRVLYSVGNEVIYVPVENEFAIRMAVTKEQAQKCFDTLKNIKVCQDSLKQPAAVAEHFQQLLTTCDINSSLIALKELLLREYNLENEGKCLRQTEQYYLAVAKKVVINELASVLELTVEETEEKIIKALELD